LITKSILSDSIAISISQEHNTQAIAKSQTQTSHSLDGVSPNTTSNHLGSLSDENDIESDE
jgi:hypothetical protein